ncbi:MAG TPA: SDR family NAD(P)-dependent oxidoreductase [Thermoanaerobaculia bacterium]|jgi:2-hydroxycyclohexanecarboxyl-CoA dehydrogenase|nr:SDR family NAD(P)-dependent oxidoreductase [Thermoanaerobaculia bacterium]
MRDRTVVVTGASRGIGRSVAQRFADEGARVALVSRSEKGLLETAARIDKAKGSCLAIPTDITEPDAAVACVGKIEKELGPVDILVNNAGVFLWKPFLKITPEEWNTVISTNLTGAANFCRAVLPGMVERRRGRIVNVASIHGMRGDANLAAHSAAKFGLVGLTQSLAREFREHNIAINAVCPGTVENKLDETEGQDRRSPLAEKLWPRDVAKAVLFLASDDAAAITGTTLEVLGGTHLTIQP